MPDFATTLIGCVQSMGHAPDLLAGQVAGAPVRSEFQAYVGADSDRLRLIGEDVRLQPRAVQTLSLALHELTTNAAKYGALSVPAGCVSVHSAIEGHELRLSWVEAGGPEVAPPDDRGFRHRGHRGQHRP